MKKAKIAIAATARRLANNLEKLLALAWEDGCPAALIKQVDADVTKLVDASADTTEERSGLITKAATELPITVANIKTDFAELEGLPGTVEGHSDYGVECRAFIALVRKHYPATK